MTAWHVLETTGCADLGTTVLVDHLGGGAAITARVERADRINDLAVLVSGQPFSPECARLTESDTVIPHTRTLVTGVSRFDDAHEYRFLEAPGIWAGATIRKDSANGSDIKLARLEARSVTHGMSGAPVRRTTDGAVVGMVSGRYNPPGTWQRDTVWVVRVEEMILLCAGVEVRDDAGSGQPEEAAVPGPDDIPVFLPVPPGRPSFWLGRHLVTNGQFRSFLRAEGNERWCPEHARGGPEADENYLRHWNGSAMPQALASFPVVNVSLASVRAYAAWLRGRLGVAARLPAVSEWRLAVVAAGPETGWPRS